MSETITASSVGTEVTQILDAASDAAAELLAEADHRADRAGRDDLAEVRATLTQRIEAVRSARERVSRLGGETVARMKKAASQLEEMPARLASELQAQAEVASFDRALEEERARSGPPAHLVALMKAADSIADDLAEEARRQANQLAQSARREADRIAMKEPKRMAKIYEPTVRRAETLKKEVEALNELLNRDKDTRRGPTKSKRGNNDESSPDERRAKTGRSWKRR
jgi:hypothetical protein